MTMKPNQEPVNERPNREPSPHVKGVTGSLADGSGQSPRTSRSTRKAVASRRQNAIAIAPTATGPRTATGKRRSSRNALKHGIFSRELLVEGESRRQFDSILKGFTEQLQPIGAVEELLVEKLAILSLREQRLLIAESAEIRRSTEFMEWDQYNRDGQELSEAVGAHKMDFGGPSPVLVPIGIVHKLENPRIRAGCLQFLNELRRRAEKCGFDQDRDSKVLATLHGGPVGLWKQYLKELQQAEDERARGGHVSSPLSKQDALQGFERDIRQLTVFGAAQAIIEDERTKLRRLCLRVPESPTLDRLMRYEAHLSREFDRALSRLERLQRMRLGQPGPPTLRVELNN